MKNPSSLDLLIAYVVLFYAYVAQLIEHFTRNEEVVGLIPAIGSFEGNVKIS